MPLSARSRGRIAVGSSDGRLGDGTARMDAQAIDVDDDAGHLAVQRPPDRVADGRVDLAGDLGDRDAQGDGQVQLDLDAVIEADGEPGLPEAEARDEARHRTAGEPGDSVRAQGGGADDVDERTTGHEGSAGSGSDGHAGCSPRYGRPDRGVPGWAVGTVCYHTAPLGPRRPGLPSLTVSEDPAWPAPARSAARFRWAASTRSRRA